MCRPTWEHGEIQINIGSLIKNFLRGNPIGRVASESGVITEHEPGYDSRSGRQLHQQGADAARRTHARSSRT